MIRRFLMRLFGIPHLTVAGRLPVVSNHDELNTLIAQRHKRGDAARKGWQSRRAR